MMFKQLIWIPVIATIMFICHDLLFSTIGMRSELNTYALSELYLFYGSMSIAVVSIGLIIARKNIDQVGMVFMAATIIKMAICYAVVRPILVQQNINVRVEQINFFMLFLLFLTIETIFTIRILNNKQL